MGSDQIKKRKVSEKKILNVLTNNDWVRYKDLQKKTKLSSATLTKRLKRLEKGIVEKKIDLESGKYPYPVYYRIKQKYASSKSDSDLVFKDITYGFLEEHLKNKDLEASFNLLNNMLTASYIAYLQNYFEDHNETAFTQNVDFFVFDIFREMYECVKQTLEKMEKEGIDINSLLLEEAKKIYSDKIVFE